MTARLARLAGLAAWMAFLAATAVSLHAVGGALAPPPLTEPGHLGHWVAARQPAEAAMAVLRLAVLAAAWYLLAATVAGALARAAGIASWVRAVDAVSVPLVRRVVHGALGVSFATAALAGPTTAAVAEERAEPAPLAAEVVTMRLLPGSGAPPTPAAKAATAGAPTMRRLDGATTTTTSSPPAPATMRRIDRTTTTPNAPGPGPEPPQAPAASPTTWEVEPGEHFWSVAERVLTSAWGRAPSDREVDPYWRALVGANTEVLRDRGNLDLLFPGQVITVPPPPAAPSR